MGSICAHVEYAEPREPEAREPEQPVPEDTYVEAQDPADTLALELAADAMFDKGGHQGPISTVLEKLSQDTQQEGTSGMQSAVQDYLARKQGCGVGYGEPAGLSLIKRLQEQQELSRVEKEEMVRAFEEENKGECVVYRGRLIQLIVQQRGEAFAIAGNGVTGCFKGTALEKFQSFKDVPMAKHLLHCSKASQTGKEITDLLKYVVELPCTCGKTAGNVQGALDKSCARCFLKYLDAGQKPQGSWIQRCFDINFSIHCGPLLQLLPDVLRDAQVPEIFFEVAKNERKLVEEHYAELQNVEKKISLEVDPLADFFTPTPPSQKHITRPIAYDNITGLMIAAAHGRVKMAQYLLPFEEGVKTTTSKETALAMAINFGHKKCAQCLAFSAREREATGMTKLMLTAFAGTLPEARNFVHMARQRDCAGNLALHYAIFSGCLEMVRFLYELEAFEPRSQSTSQPESQPTESQPQPQARTLLPLGNRIGVTPLMLAARCDFVEAVQCLSKEPSHTNAKSAHGSTALLVAVEENKRESAMVLFEKAGKEEQNESLLTCILKRNLQLAHSLDLSLLDFKDMMESQQFALDSNAISELSQSLYEGLQIIQRGYTGQARKEKLDQLHAAYNYCQCYKGFLVEFCIDTEEGTAFLAGNTVIRSPERVFKEPKSLFQSDAQAFEKLQKAVFTIPRELFELFALFAKYKCTCGKTAATNDAWQTTAATVTATTQDNFFSTTLRSTVGKTTATGGQKKGPGPQDGLKAVLRKCPACLLQSFGPLFGQKQYYEALRASLLLSPSVCTGLLLQQAQHFSQTGITKTMVWAALGVETQRAENAKKDAVASCSIPFVPVLAQEELARQDASGLSALMYAADRGNFLEALKLLPAELGLLNAKGNGALHRAIWGSGPVGNRRRIAIMIREALGAAANGQSNEPENKNPELSKGLSLGLLDAFIAGTRTQDVDAEGRNAEDYAALGNRFLAGPRWEHAALIAVQRGLARVAILALSHGLGEGSHAQSSSSIGFALVQYRAYRVLRATRGLLAGRKNQKGHTVLQEALSSQEDAAVRILLPVEFMALREAGVSGRACACLNLVQSAGLRLKPFQVRARYGNVHEEAFNRRVCGAVVSCVVSSGGMGRAADLRSVPGALNERLQKTQKLISEAGRRLEKQ